MQLFEFIHQAAQRVERIHDDLVHEHKEEKRQLHEVKEERDQLGQENNDLQAQVDQVTDKFRSLWLTISNVVIEAPEDFTSCVLVNCCDHISTMCLSLIAMNAYMKNKLETVRSTLPDSTKIYA